MTLMSVMRHLSSRDIAAWSDAYCKFRVIFALGYARYHHFFTLSIDRTAGSFAYLPRDALSVVDVFWFAAIGFRSLSLGTLKPFHFTVHNLLSINKGGGNPDRYA